MVVWLVFWVLLVGVFCLVLLVRCCLGVVVLMVVWGWGLWLVVRGLVRRWVRLLVVVVLLGCLVVLVGVVFVVVGLMCRLVRRCWGWVFQWVRWCLFWVGSVLWVVYEEGASGFPCLCGLPGAPSCVLGVILRSRGGW